MPIEIDGEMYYTVTEAAEYLNISRETFYQSVKKRLQPYRVGVLKRLHYRKSDLDEFTGAEPVEYNGK